jgi:hypothetical protein
MYAFGTCCIEVPVFRFPPSLHVHKPRSFHQKKKQHMSHPSTFFLSRNRHGSVGFRVESCEKARRKAIGLVSQDFREGPLKIPLQFLNFEKHGEVCEEESQARRRRGSNIYTLAPTRHSQDGQAFAVETNISADAIDRRKSNTQLDSHLPTHSNQAIYFQPSCPHWPMSNGTMRSTNLL